jgi:hypothetical protein
MWRVYLAISISMKSFNFHNYFNIILCNFFRCSDKIISIEEGSGKCSKPLYVISTTVVPVHQRNAYCDIGKPL